MKSLGIDSKGKEDYIESIQSVEGNDSSLPSHRLLKGMESGRWIKSESGGKCNNEV
jgi:hypothetical protein